jgi:hypothetical protein
MVQGTANAAHRPLSSPSHFSVFVEYDEKEPDGCDESPQEATIHERNSSITIPPCMMCQGEQKSPDLVLNFRTLNKKHHQTDRQFLILNKKEKRTALPQTPGRLQACSSFSTQHLVRNSSVDYISSFSSCQSVCMDEGFLGIHCSRPDNNVPKIKGQFLSERNQKIRERMNRIR